MTVQHKRETTAACWQGAGWQHNWITALATASSPLSLIHMRGRATAAERQEDVRMTECDAGGSAEDSTQGTWGAHLDGALSKCTGGTQHDGANIAHQQTHGALGIVVLEARQIGHVDENDLWTSGQQGSVLGPGKRASAEGKEGRAR